ncbi:hypothetical protein B0H10DRAFT_2393157, partial [Mycena sp. CBHHK59/15]
MATWLRSSTSSLRKPPKPEVYKLVLAGTQKFGGRRYPCGTGLVLYTQSCPGHLRADKHVSRAYPRVKGIKSSNNFPMMLVATKCDESIKRHPWIPSVRSALKRPRAREAVGCKFVETSSGRSIHVDDVFMELVRDIRRFNKVTYAGL